MMTDIGKANVLRDLTVEFASLVDEPANKGARVLMFKKDSAGEKPILGEWENWTDAVVKLAEQLAPGDLIRGLRAVQQHFGDVWTRFLREVDGEQGEKKMTTTTTTAKGLFEGALDKMAAEELRRDPTAHKSFADAYVAVLKSAVGQRLAKASMAPDAGLEIDEWLERRRHQTQLEKISDGRWHSLDDCIGELHKAAGGDQQALETVRKQYEPIYDGWLHETSERTGVRCDCTVCVNKRHC